jgi:hypothetical protein
MTMNARTTKLMTLVAVGVIFGLFSLAEPALAQSNCKEAKGNWFDANSTNNTTAGTITNGGILDGTTVTVYPPAFVIVPGASTTAAYTGSLTITTHEGQLNTSNVYIYEFVSGLWTAMGLINPSTSTGRFAGATGVLYFNGKTTNNGTAYPSNITGQICFAN